MTAPATYTQQPGAGPAAAPQGWPAPPAQSPYVPNGLPQPQPGGGGVGWNTPGAGWNLPPAGWGQPPAGWQGQSPQYQQGQQAPTSAPAQPQAQAQPSGLSMSSVIPQGDPNFPPELHGRTLGDAFRFYNIMKDHFQANPPGRQQPAGRQPSTMQSMPGQAGQPTGVQGQGQGQQPQGQPQAGQLTAAEFWRDPVNNIRALIQESLQPVTQASVQQQAQQVYQQVAAQNPDWRQYEGAIAQMASQADPHLLTNPEAWQRIYWMAKGQALSQGGQRQIPAQTGGYQGPGQVSPAPQQFFTEAPTPPTPQSGAQQPTPLQVQMAQKFGQPLEVYMAHTGGRVPPPQQRAPQGPMMAWNGQGWQPVAPPNYNGAGFQPPVEVPRGY